MTREGDFGEEGRYLRNEGGVRLFAQRRAVGVADTLSLKDASPGHDHNHGITRGSELVPQTSCCFPGGKVLLFPNHRVLCKLKSCIQLMLPVVTIHPPAVSFGQKDLSVTG